MYKGNPFIEETESWKEQQKAKGRSAEEVERQAERAREVREQIEQRAQQRWEEQRRVEERRAEEEARKRAEAVARRMAEEERRRQLIEATEEWRQGVAARGILSEKEAAMTATLAQEFRPGAVQEMRRRAEERLAEEREMRRRAEEEARRKAEEEAAGVPSKAPEARPADELARELVERAGPVAERIRQAVESGDVDGLVKALKEAGIDKVKIPAWLGAGIQGGEIPVDQLRDVFERIREATRTSPRDALHLLWSGTDAGDVVVGVAKTMGLRV